MKTMIANLCVLAVLAGSSFAQPNPPPPPPSSPAGSQNQTPQGPPPVAPPTSTGPAAPTMSALELKAALCQIDVVLSAMDGQPVPASEAPLCQPFFSIENMSSYIAAGAKSLNFGALGNSLVTYYSIRAFAFGAQQCGSLANLQSAVEKSAKLSTGINSSWETTCRAHYTQMRFIQALVTHDPGVVAACQATIGGDQESSAEVRSKAAELCQSAATARDLKAFGATACHGKKKCADLFAAASGEASACHERSVEAVGGRDLCQGFVAFASAGPAKNPSACGDNNVCLAMAGNAMRATVDAQSDVAANLGPIFLPEAQARLKKLTAAVDPLNEAASKELEARAERIAALRYKSDPASRAPAQIRKGDRNAQ